MKQSSTPRMRAVQSDICVQIRDSGYIKTRTKKLDGCVHYEHEFMQKVASVCPYTG